MREIKARDFFDQAYFEGKTRQSPPHSRELIYPLAARTAAFLCHRFRPRSVLDLGCAKGYLAEAFQAEGVPHVSGVDISLYAIGQSEASTRGKLIAADVQVGLPLSSSSYDLVTALDIFEHLPEPT
ncbi:MAG: class I SAM-dependent methyltransferase, partial [Acidobacteriota bacterium]